MSLTTRSSVPDTRDRMPARSMSRLLVVLNVLERTICRLLAASPITGAGIWGVILQSMGVMAADHPGRGRFESGAEPCLQFSQSALLETHFRRPAQAAQAR